MLEGVRVCWQQPLRILGSRSAELAGSLGVRNLGERQLVIRSRMISAITVVEDPFGEGMADGVPLAPGLFVSATVEGEIVPDVMVAPRAALRESNLIYVAEPEDSKMHIHEVNVVYTNREFVYFDDGAEVGDLAILSPIQAPFDGMNITQK